MILTKPHPTREELQQLMLTPIGDIKGILQENGFWDYSQDDDYAAYNVYAECRGLDHDDDEPVTVDGWMLVWATDAQAAMIMAKGKEIDDFEWERATGFDPSWDAEEWDVVEVEEAVEGSDY